MKTSKRYRKKDILFKPYQKGDEEQIHWYDKRLVSFLSTFVGFWEKYFRYEVVGLENVPKVKGALLANNHGLIMFDVILLARLLFKMGRPPRALADYATWKVPYLREVLLNMGIVDGTPKTAIRLLRANQIVIVFPGGAKEGLKSHADRYKLYWKDHYGFIKVAIAAQKPIIPCFTAGIDHCYHVFADGYKWTKKIVGTYIPTPVFTGIGPMPFPVKLKHYIGKPIYLNAPQESYRDENIVKKMHKRVCLHMEILKEEALADYKVWQM